MSAARNLHFRIVALPCYGILKYIRDAQFLCKSVCCQDWHRSKPEDYLPRKPLHMKTVSPSPNLRVGWFRFGQSSDGEPAGYTTWRQAEQYKRDGLAEWVNHHRAIRFTSNAAETLQGDSCRMGGRIIERAVIGKSHRYRQIVEAWNPKPKETASEYSKSETRKAA